MTTGKRKKATARATVKKGSGAVRINSFPLEFYSPELYRARIGEALEIAGDMISKLDIFVSVKGGGKSGQTTAIRTAIATALVEHTKSEALKKKFKEYDRNLLVSDMRQKEPHKPGGRGARAKRQKSYR